METIRTTPNDVEIEYTGVDLKCLDKNIQKAKYLVFYPDFKKLHVSLFADYTKKELHAIIKLFENVRERCDEKDHICLYRNLNFCVRLDVRVAKLKRVKRFTQKA